eukprot:gene26182-31615_t
MVTATITARSGRKSVGVVRPGRICSPRLFSSSSPGGATGSGGEARYYPSYSVYKGKAAMSVKYVPPSFSSGATRRVEREGSIFLEFAPIGSKPREYDWTKKQVFSLTATETGEFIDMDYTKGIEFYHDPGAQTPEAGKVGKKLKITPNTDGKGVMITLQVTERNAAAPIPTLMLPATRGELEVVKGLGRYLLPYMLGFDKVV